MQDVPCGILRLEEPVPVPLIEQVHDVGKGVSCHRIGVGPTQRVGLGLGHEDEVFAVGLDQGKQLRLQSLGLDKVLPC